MTKKDDQKPCKTWDLTYFYDTIEERDQQVQKWNEFDVSRCVVGDEVGDDTGRAHLQIKVTFKRAYRFKQLKKILHAKYHMEQSKCIADFNYCMKDNILVNRDNGAQGSRSDIRGAMSLVKAKKPRLQLMEEYPTVVARYGPFLTSYGAELAKYHGPRFVMWLYGDTGVGKTRLAYDIIPGIKGVDIDGGRFFLGYAGEPYVLLDDFRVGTMPFYLLLKILDRYPIDVSVKGGSVHWNARIIIITSPFPPHIYAEGEDYQQLLRRINVLGHLPDQYDECRSALYDSYKSEQEVCVDGSGVSEPRSESDRPGETTTQTGSSSSSGHDEIADEDEIYEAASPLSPSWCDSEESPAYFGS